MNKQLNISINIKDIQKGPIQLINNKTGQGQTTTLIGDAVITPELLQKTLNNFIQQKVSQSLQTNIQDQEN